MAGLDHKAHGTASHSTGSEVAGSSSCPAVDMYQIIEPSRSATLLPQLTREWTKK